MWFVGAIRWDGCIGRSKGYEDREEAERLRIYMILCKCKRVWVFFAKGDGGEDEQQD